MKTVGFRGTEDYRWGLKQAAGARRRSVQKMIEDAVELYLAVSPERYKAGDIERLKEYAAVLAKHPDIKAENLDQFLEAYKSGKESSKGLAKTTVPVNKSSRASRKA